MIKNSDFVENPWQTLSEEMKYDNPWIRVTEYQVINPGGGKGIYGKVHFKNKAIGVVPIDHDNHIWLVGQYRYTLSEWSWEIPEGGGPAGQSPLEAAQRELLEETGLIASRWTQVLRLHTSNSVTDEEGFIFIAEDLTQGESSPEETEADMQRIRIPLKEAVDMVFRGEITDSLAIMGILAAARIKGI